MNTLSDASIVAEITKAKEKILGGPKPEKKKKEE
jgi:hypothetical protein